MCSRKVLMFGNSYYYFFGHVSLIKNILVDKKRFPQVPYFDTGFNRLQASALLEETLCFSHIQIHTNLID